jgi:hypothetical protein
MFNSLFGAGLFGSNIAGADPDTLRKALDFTKFDLMALLKLYFKWQAQYRADLQAENSIFTKLWGSNSGSDSLTLREIQFQNANFVEQKFKVLEVKPEDTEITWQSSYKDKSKTTLEAQGFFRKEVLPEPIVEDHTEKLEDLSEPLKHAIREALKEKMIPILLAKQFVSLVENQLEKELNASA